MPGCPSSRRRFLAGSIGATSWLLAGCVGDDSSSNDESTANETAATAADVFLATTSGPDRAVGGDEADDGVFAMTIPSASEFDRACSLDDYTEEASTRITDFVEETDFDAESLLFASRQVPDPSYEFEIAATFVAGNAAVLRTETVEGSDGDSRGETPAVEISDSILVRVDPSVDGVETIAVVHDGKSYEPSPSNSFDSN